MNHLKRHRRNPRSGVAMAIVIVLIGLFAALCQTLTMLVAMQHRQAFHAADQAQTHRLAEAGLLRALSHLQHDSAWPGETWKPTVSNSESAVVTIAASTSGSQITLTSDAELTPSRGKVLKSHQSLTIARPSVARVESSLP